MARHTGWLFAALLAWTTPTPAGADELRCAQGDQQKPTTAAAASAPRDQPSHGDRWKWWLHNRAELGISDQQSAQIDQIWESTVPSLREMRKNVEALEEALSKTVKAYSVDVATLGREIDKVERARAEYSKTRALMLYKIDLVLTPDQRTKVRALREKREAERRKDDRRH
jgi:Spy/CpxP family protein refolding chaperone